ncbi:hypothetical protein LSTR_LSTR007558 [Laodelphax striatellus]|uniref:Resistance to inhibitors of cholinesterase protein 3 N-terminal domain-containing protein n=1 Tax=Laodelphax striatellus TaxID=195883 RepID=A0A482XU72_LAOST|nr:hypothetical protein LSTR_LSTR007558 [Laodelphax striatellus]
MPTEFGTGKTVFILAIVVGCFAVLWPKIFYPMLQSTVAPKPPDVESTNECCDVIFEKDINLIKIMTELCEKILRHEEDFDKRLVMNFQQGKLTKEIIDRCKNEVMTKCDIDITTFLEEKARLGQSYKQILDDVRSLNSSLCLKENFGVTPNSLGAPRYLKIWTLTTAKHLRQERPPHLRPEMMHPALRERGRAIPQSHRVPKVIEKEGRPPVVPGMRPPMGGAGHVVPAPKGGTTMGIIMPMYTIGIVIFFMYTMMKLLFRKSEESNAYQDFKPDPEFRRVVFNESDYYHNRPSTHHHPHKVEEESATKLGWKERDAKDIELDQLRRRLAETEAAMERIVKLVTVPPKSEPNKKECESDVFEKEISSPEEAIKFANQVDSAKSEVRVLGMELTESIEGGQRWSRPSTPLPHRAHTPTPVPPDTPAQEIFLEGSLPSQSHLLVSQSEVEKLIAPDHDDGNYDDDASVILTGKVTLSLIGVDSVRFSS